MRESLPVDHNLHSFRTADGATVEYIEDRTAAPGSPVLVYHHGTPGAGPMDPVLLKAARAAGFRTVQLVRPGYGGTRRPDRTVADNTLLTAALVEHLGATTFASCGWSGGGPHTLADAALLPHCRGSVSIASVAPYDAEGLDYLAGMGQDNVEEFGAATDPMALEGLLSTAIVELAHITNESVRAMMASLLPPADLAHIQQADNDLAGSFRWSVADGIWGWYDDDRAFVKPWGFDVADIRKPVILLQGSEDLMVPFAHGQWLADAIPGVHAHLAEGEGHLSVAARHLHDAMQELAAC